MLKIKDKVTNKQVRERMNSNLNFLIGMKEIKLEFAGHTLKGSSGSTHVLLLEGKLYGKRTRGRPLLTWTDDIIGWTRLATYEMVKRTTEDKNDGNP